MDALHHRIWRAGDPRVPIIRVIDQWLEEGRAIEESELFRTMKQLRSFRRYGHALEVSFPIYIYIYMYAYMYVWCNCVCVFCIWVCTDVHFG
jgi:hypothetical protein